MPSERTIEKNPACVVSVCGIDGRQNENVLHFHPRIVAPPGSSSQAKHSISLRRGRGNVFRSSGELECCIIHVPFSLGSLPAQARWVFFEALIPRPRTQARVLDRGVPVVQGKYVTCPILVGHFVSGIGRRLAPGYTCSRDDTNRVIRVHLDWGGLPPQYRGKRGEYKPAIGGWCCSDWDDKDTVRTERFCFHCTRWLET